MKNPWNILDSKKVYANNWIEVSHHEVVTPTGNNGIYGIVDFKNIAVGIIPLDNENNIWLVGQYRLPIEKYSWEIPEGGAPDNENTLEAAKRELREEAGILAESWTKICTFYTSNSVTNEQAVIYLAQKLSFTDYDPDPTEKLEIKKIPIQNAIGMIFDGTITDSITIIGLLWIKEKMNLK